MDKKNFFRTAGKAIAMMLLAATMMAGFSACSDNDNDNNNTTPSGETLDPYEEPTTDQLEVKVTADMPTAVLAKFDDNSVGTALVKRLTKTTATIDDNTKLVLIDGNHTEMLTEDYFYKLVRVYMNGGYIALQRPTLGVALAVALGLEGKAAEIQNDILKEHGVEIYDDGEAERIYSSWYLL